MHLTRLPSQAWRIVWKIPVVGGSLRAQPYIFIVLFAVIFTYLISVMGTQNVINTFTKTAYDLLMNVVFLTMAMTTLAGAFGRLISEFGLIGLLNALFRHLMKPLYGLPGIAFMGAFSAFLSENMAIIPFARDPEFIRRFNKAQIPLLCNLGTSAGMGLFIITLMMGFGLFPEAVIGLIGALVGSVISVRLLQLLIRKKIRAESIEPVPEEPDPANAFDLLKVPDNRGFGERLLNAIIDGGRYGVDIGLGMIPGVLVICSFLMILMKGPAVIEYELVPESAAIETGIDVVLSAPFTPVDTLTFLVEDAPLLQHAETAFFAPANLAPYANIAGSAHTFCGYTGGAYEGVDLIPKVTRFVRPILAPVLGFHSSESVGLTLASLGSAGAAVALLKDMKNAMSGLEIAVFAAFAILWSGFLSTHIAIMDALGYRRFTQQAILSHFIAGFAAGITAHVLYKLFFFFHWIG